MEARAERGARDPHSPKQIRSAAIGFLDDTRGTQHTKARRQGWQGKHTTRENTTRQKHETKRWQWARSINEPDPRTHAPCRILPVRKTPPFPRPPGSTPPPPRDTSLGTPCPSFPAAGKRDECRCGWGTQLLRSLWPFTAHTYLPRQGHGATVPTLY